MNFQDEMLSAFEQIASKYLENNNPTNEIATVVVSKKGNKYGIKYNGGEYMVTDGINLNPSIGTQVWVRLPSGKLNNAYICAKRG
jgi:hypothetical protein